MKKAALCIVGITIILLVAIGLCAGEQLWKLYTDVIPYRVFQKLDERYEHFIGQPIDDVLPLIAKDDQYLVVTRDYQGYPPYDSIILQYPEFTLKAPRDKMYFIPTKTRLTNDAAYSIGFFVDSDGYILERYFPVPFGW